MTRVRLSLPLAALIALTPVGFAPVPPPKPKKPDGQKLNLKVLSGTWRVVGYEYRHARGVSTSNSYDRVDIKNGQWVQKRTVNGREVRLSPYTIKIDTKKKPHLFDMYLGSSKSKTPSRKGLFRLEGDRLTVTYTMGSNPRPASVHGGMVVSQYRWVLRRESQ